MPTHHRVFRKQKHGFADRDATSESAAALDDTLMWLTKHFHGNSSAGAGAPARPGPNSSGAATPTSEDWFPNGGTFRNVGEANWHAVRAQWRTYSRTSRPAPPPPVPYGALVEGLATPKRTFELPGRITLPAIVDVLFDIWQDDLDD